MESQRALADRLFPTVVEEEEVELRNIPPEQRRLHTESSDLTISVLHQYMTSEKIEIPEFQRGYVWNRTQASRLIESLVIQCPIPVVYFSQGQNNKLVVIDGNQRLLSIKLFLSDAFELQGLTTYPELNGAVWSKLDPRFRDHINNRTLRCITILKDTHPQIKFDVFERLNTGSVKLNAQELRHGINHGHLIRELDDLVTYKPWREAVGIRNDKRMKGAELVLRYFALRNARAEYSKPLTSFLDQYSEKVRSISSEDVEILKADFIRTVELVNFAYGKSAFKILSDKQGSGQNFNSAVYDAQMIGFAETSNDLIKTKNYERESLVSETKKLFLDERFANSVRRATSDELAVKTRIDMFLDFLNSFK